MNNILCSMFMLMFTVQFSDFKQTTTYSHLVISSNQTFMHLNFFCIALSFFALIVNIHLNFKRTNIFRRKIAPIFMFYCNRVSNERNVPQNRVVTHKCCQIDVKNEKKGNGECTIAMSYQMCVCVFFLISHRTNDLFRFSIHPSATVHSDRI